MALDEALEAFDQSAHLGADRLERRARGTSRKVRPVIIRIDETAFPRDVGSIGLGIGFDADRAGRQSEREPHVAGFAPGCQNATCAPFASVVMRTLDDHQGALPFVLPLSTRWQLTM